MDYDSFDWMTEEMKEQCRRIDRMIQMLDMDATFELEDNRDFASAMNGILDSKCQGNPASLNHWQRTLYLCIHLENAGQADHILGFLQEDHPEYQEEAVAALNEIGAFESAKIIARAIEILPKDGSWFFASSDEKSEKLMSALNSQFSSYPDGEMPDLYRRYAEEHRAGFRNET